MPTCCRSKSGLLRAIVAACTRSWFCVPSPGLVVFALLIGGMSSMGQALSVETFDAPLPSDGHVCYSADPLYFVSIAACVSGGTGGNQDGNVHENAFILQNFNVTDIAYGEGGSGYFLYNQTLVDTTPSYAGQVWGSTGPVSVNQQTDYVFSFYLTNRDASNVAQIEPRIGGSPIGSSVSALGYFADGNAAHEWQEFSFLWNSGNNSAVNLSLVNLTSTGSGNDFGIDSISLTEVPEPTSLALLLVGGVILAARRRLAGC